MRPAAYELAHAELDSVIAKQPDDAYWRLYQATARLRLGQPLTATQPAAASDSWPALLLSFLFGRVSEEDAAQADPTAAAPKRGSSSGLTWSRTILKGPSGAGGRSSIMQRRR